MNVNKIVNLLFVACLQVFACCSGDDEPVVPGDITNYGEVASGEYVATGNATSSPFILEYEERVTLLSASLVFYGKYSGEIEGTPTILVCQSVFADTSKNLDEQAANKVREMKCNVVAEKDGFLYLTSSANDFSIDMEYVYQLRVVTDEGMYYGDIKRVTCNYLNLDIKSGEAREIDETTFIIEDCSFNNKLLIDKSLTYLFGLCYIRDDDFEYYKSMGYSEFEIMENLAKQIPYEPGYESNFSYEMANLKKYNAKYYYAVYVRVGVAAQTYIGDIRTIERPSLGLQLNTLTCAAINNTSVKVKASVKSSVIKADDSYEFGIAFLEITYGPTNPSAFDEKYTHHWEFRGLQMANPEEMLNEEYEIVIGRIDEDLIYRTKLSFCAYVKYKGEYYYGNRIEFSFKSQSNIDNTKIIGNAVDLGLSVLWSDCTIGAGCSVDAFAPFKWGGVVVESNHYWFYEDHSWKAGIDYTLMPEEDAANVLWGDGWRMPTKEEFAELNEKCLKVKYIYDDCWDGRTTYTTTTFIGPNGNSIEMCEGYYWTSNSTERSKYESVCMQLTHTELLLKDGERACHFGIRPVKDKTK